MSAVTVWRAANYVRMPWKNGGGSTEEISRDGGHGLEGAAPGEGETDPTAGMEGASAPATPGAEPAAAEDDPMKALQEAAKEAKPAAAARTYGPSF